VSVTALLIRWGEGDPRALDELTPLVYAELKRLAQRHLRRERRGHTLQATALVHEAFVRLVDQREMAWQNRAQFFAIAARLMRRLLVDHARARAAKKRGGAAVPVTLELDREVAQPERGVDLLRLDDALERLAALDETQARIVELRYFAGLTIEQTAEAVGSSPATVKREWTHARAWLRRQLAPET
jgi:RNA polymerase sigma factor (TIGR02999 family)